jgi:hypothetical protein
LAKKISSYGEWMAEKKEYKVRDIGRSQELEIKLLDEEGNPMANVSYTLIFKGGTELKGTTDENGVGKHKDAPEEEFEIILSSEREVA